MIDITIRLKEGKTLKDVVAEVQQLNSFFGTEQFPRPIPCNPEEGTVGLVNTPPDENGYVNIRIDYEYLDLSFLPAQPTTFNFVIGKPATTGVFA
jgi:hypothetical protein